MVGLQGRGLKVLNGVWVFWLRRLILGAFAPAFVVASCFLTAVSAQAKPAVEVAFVLDTTGSMASLIEGAKRKIWSIATNIVDENPGADIRMGLIAYRDIGDEYVTQRIELTADIQDLYARLLELRARDLEPDPCVTGRGSRPLGFAS